MKDNNGDSLYSFAELLEAINNIQKYTGKCKGYSTFLGQEASRWGRGKRKAFQEFLEDDDLHYFAYIKFFIDDGTPYAIVAGKSGSTKVNSSGCDLKFYTYPKYKGKAKEWLSINKKEWCQTKILVIRTESIGDESENEAFKIEKDLMKRFNLLGS